MLKKISFILFLTLIISVNSAISQEEKTPVEDVFACAMNIDSQTPMSPMKGWKEIIIHHRIGQIKSLSDLFGVYGPANARLGFNYGVTDKLMLSFGTEKFNKLQELMWKYALLKQQENGNPVFISYTGNFVINAQNESHFGSDYSFTDRFSYFHQIIIARKFSERLSLQIAPYFLHFNKVDSLMSNQAVGANIGGRFKVWNEISLIGEFTYTYPLESIDYPTDIDGNDVPGDPKPGISFGIEKNTGTHAFQLIATTNNGIIPQQSYLFNKRDISSLLIGFNITVRI